jgi:hypothetical protein
MKKPVFGNLSSGLFVSQNQSQSASFERTNSKLFLCFSTLFIISLAFWIGIFRHQLPAITDLFLDIYPNKVFNIDQFHRGIIPLWNSWVGCGIPQLASWQSSCWYPFFWIWTVLGNPDSLSIVCVLHSGLACLGFFLWMRSQKISSVPSFLGAISFSGSALFIRCWAYPHHIAALTWIPWIFWSMDQNLKKNNILAQMLPILFLSLQILGGYPIFIVYTWLILIFWFFAQKPSGQNRLWFAAQFLMALGLTSLQWIPFGEFLTYCGRGGWWKEFPYFDKPIDYLTLLNPGLLGTPGSTDYQGTTANFVFNLYFGVIAFLIWVWGCVSLFLKKIPQNYFWKIASLTLWLWMAGSHFFIFKVIPENILELLEPSKAVSLFIFSASTVAAIQFQAWLTQCRKTLTFYGLTALSLLWVFDILAVPFQLLHPIPNLFQQTEMSEKAGQIKQIVQNKRILSLSTESQLAFTGPDRLEKSIEEPASYFLSNSNGAWKIRSVDYYLSIWVKNSQNIQLYCNKGFPYRGDLLDVAGVRLFLFPQKISSSNKYQAIGKWKNDFLTLNQQASENLRWVGESIDYPDAPSILNVLAQPHSGWHKKIYLEKNSNGAYVALAPTGRAIPIALTENNQRFNSNQTSLSDIFAGPGYVIFNDSYAPGWHAWVDGQPSPILRAYGLFMAVPLSTGGPHQIDFRYEPISFRFGLFLSMIFLWFFLLIAARKGVNEILFP